MVDVNTPVTNPELVDAINKFQDSPDRDKEKIFLEELAKAHFLAPVFIKPAPKSENEDNTVTLKEDTIISFQMITDAEGDNFLLVFTDWEELGKWKKEENQQTMIVTFDDLATMVMGGGAANKGFALNPYGQNIIMSKETINSMKNPKQVQEHVIEKDTTVTIGTPANYPYELAEAIKRHSKKTKEIKKVYLFLMVKDSEESFLLVVDFVGDRKKIFDGIAEAGIPYLKKGQFIDLVPASDETWRNSTKGEKPIYKRGLFG